MIALLTLARHERDKRSLRSMRDERSKRGAAAIEDMTRPKVPTRWILRTLKAPLAALWVVLLALPPGPAGPAATFAVNRTGDARRDERGERRRTRDRRFGQHDQGAGDQPFRRRRHPPQRHEQQGGGQLHRHERLRDRRPGQRRKRCVSRCRDGIGGTPRAGQKLRCRCTATGRRGWIAARSRLCGIRPCRPPV
jgi:hypothetical protein